MVVVEAPPELQELIPAARRGVWDEWQRKVVARLRELSQTGFAAWFQHRRVARAVDSFNRRYSRTKTVSCAFNPATRQDRCPVLGHGIEGVRGRTGRTDVTAPGVVPGLWSAAAFNRDSPARGVLSLTES